MEHRIGFIGLGNIGKPMAVNLLRAGGRLTVYDLRREVLDEVAELGARVAASAREPAVRSNSRVSVESMLSPRLLHQQRSPVQV